MKKIHFISLKITISLLFFATNFSFSQTLNLTGIPNNEGINFISGKWADVLVEAKLKHKYIFVDCYTDWCGPCKWMAKNIFTTGIVGEFYNEHFINYKIDSEKGDGIEFTKKYKISGWPSFVFFDSLGNIVHIYQSTREAEEFIRVGKNAFNPDSALYSLKKRYDDGDRNDTLILNYMHALKNAYWFVTKYQDVAHQYLKHQNKEQLLTKTNWEFIKEYCTDITDPTFIYLIRDQDEFITKYGKQEVYEKIFLTKLNYYSRNNDWVNYALISEGYFKLIPDIDAETLNTIIWNFYEKVTDKLELKRSERWGKKLVAMSPSYTYLDTYAHLLSKAGDKSEAITVAKQAIAAAKKDNEDYSTTQEFLKQLNKIPSSLAPSLKRPQ